MWPFSSPSDAVTSVYTSRQQQQEPTTTFEPVPTPQPAPAPLDSPPTKRPISADNPLLEASPILKYFKFADPEPGTPAAMMRDDGIAHLSTENLRQNIVSYDYDNLKIIGASLIVAVVAPRFFKLNKQQTLGVALGSWIFGSYLLIGNLNLKWKEQESKLKKEMARTDRLKAQPGTAGAAAGIEGGSAVMEGLKGSAAGGGWEGGFGGQEGLRDKFATTSGEH